MSAVYANGSTDACDGCGRATLDGGFICPCLANLCSAGCLVEHMKAGHPVWAYGPPTPWFSLDGPSFPEWADAEARLVASEGTAA